MLNLTNEQLRKAMKLQRELVEEADIAYQCFHENINLIEFFQKYLWDKL